MLDTAKEIISKLHAAGHQAFLVGGCVRDMFLGKTPKDYDVTTDATPEQVLSVFPRGEKIGAHFGVVMVAGVEIATFRSDGSYGDGRRPDSVQYEKTPEADSERRDFTFNAMYYDPFTKKLLDFHGGRADLNARLLRTVGNPYDRFQEDHLRMLRAVRFATRFGFSIEPKTLEAIQSMSHLITKVAVERNTVELLKTLATPNQGGKAFDHLHNTGILALLIPEVSALEGRDLQQTRKALSMMEDPTPAYAMAVLLHKAFAGNPLGVNVVFRRLKLSNEETAEIQGILNLQSVIEKSTDFDMGNLKRLLRSKFFDRALQLFGIRTRIGEASPALFTKLSSLYQGWTVDDLNPAKFVTGDDLSKLGLKPGPKFKSILDDIELKQLNGVFKTKEQAIDYVRQNFLS